MLHEEGQNIFWEHKKLPPHSGDKEEGNDEENDEKLLHEAPSNAQSVV